MIRPARIEYYRYFIIISALIMLLSCESSKEGFIIVTETQTEVKGQNFVSGESWRYHSQSKLVLVDPSQRGKPGKNITEGYYAACSPCISFDGKTMVFAAKKKQGDFWQIWEMYLPTLKIKQVTNFESNSTDPVYLPNGNFIFSYALANDSLKAGHSLYTSNPDGKELSRITFNPHTYFSSSILKDGRIVTINRQLLPELSKQNLMVMRPDGTKAELFYQPAQRNILTGRCVENTNGRIYFIETSDSLTNSGKLVSVTYNRPLHSHSIADLRGGGNYLAVSNYVNGDLLVCYKDPENNRFAVYTFHTESGKTGELVYNSKNNIIDVAFIQALERPRKLPSEVDMGAKTGLLLCQNINLTGMKSPEAGFSQANAVKIEVLGLNESYGIAEVEKDGSVYLKIAADTPFRIQTLDSLGNVVNGPGGWYYLRPNERRGCVGCHEDNEITPANRYSLAVSKNPLIFPVHVTGIKEKEVELE